jgi:hypothetical protein
MAPVKLAHNDNYIQYGLSSLPWQGKLQVVASRKIKEDGLYRIVFQTQAVNNTANWGKPINVMVTTKLFIDDKMTKIWTENIIPKRHYANPTIVKDIELKKDSVIEIKMRADSTTQFPSESVFILLSKERFQFDVTKG